MCQWRLFLFQLLCLQVRVSFDGLNCLVYGESRASDLFFMDTYGSKEIKFVCTHLKDYCEWFITRDCLAYFCVLQNLTRWRRCIGYLKLQQVFYAKGPQITGLICRKWPINKDKASYGVSTLYKICYLRCSLSTSLQSFLASHGWSHF